jgi:hypothetical protein
VAGSSNDFLSGLLGADAYGAPSAPVTTPGATQQVNDEVKRAKDEERQKRERGESGSGGHFSVIPRSGTAMPGGYTFDAETIAAKIREFEALKEQIERLGRDLQNAGNAATPPSFDQPAVAQAEAAKTSIGTKAVEHNMALQQYAQSLLDGLHKANGTYVTRDEDTAGLFGTSTNSDQPPTGTGDLFTKRGNQ